MIVRLCAETRTGTNAHAFVSVCQHAFLCVCVFDCACVSTRLLGGGVCVCMCVFLCVNLYSCVQCISADNSIGCSKVPVRPDGECLIYVTWTSSSA